MKPRKGKKRALVSNINSNLSARKIYNAHSISALRVGSINEIPPPDTMCKYLSNEEGRAGSSFHPFTRKDNFL